MFSAGEKLGSLLVIASFGVLLVGCQPLAQPPKSSGQGEIPLEDPSGDTAVTQVELDIFSGLPNPEWPMSEDESQIFNEMLEACPEIYQTEMSEDLGYRGFVVHTKQLPNSTELAAIRIRDGVVSVSKGGVESYCQDVDKKIETWLLEQSRQFVDKDLQDIVEASLRNE